MRAVAAAAVPAALLALAVLLAPERRGRARRRLSALAGARPGADGTRGAGAHGDANADADADADAGANADVDAGANADVEADADVGAGAVAELAELVSAVSRAGLAPGRTWALVAARPGRHAGAALAASRWAGLGVPPGRALLRARGTPPGPELLALAIAMDVCERAGAPTGEVLDGLAEALRAQDTARQERDAALAAPRATAVVMAVLPAAGLALGALLGADPLAVLLLTGPGHACLVAGAAFWSAGRWWTRRLVAAAVRAG